MGQFRSRLRNLRKAPGVPQARHIAERAVTPYLRADHHQLGIDHGLTVERVTELETKVAGMQTSLNMSIANLLDRIGGLESYQPALLNAISSYSGAARLLARDMAAGDEQVRNEIRPHIETLAWLTGRLETVRAEVLHELRYGQQPAAVDTPVEVRIVNQSAVDVADPRVNFGAGHLAMAGYINVDIRELPGIDVVAPADSLPFEPESLAEIFSSHTIEHFPDLQLRRTLLPYWVSLLRPGGVFRAVVPDMDAMARAYSTGDMSFNQLRAVTYGGQEYAGDFHFTGFTPESLGSLLRSSGLVQVNLIATGRVNGDCLEFEISAIKPES